MKRTVVRLALSVGVILSAVFVACGGQTTSSIIFTAEAENKLANAKATEVAVATVLAAGGSVDTTDTGTGGQGGTAGSLVATARAAATATAAAGGVASPTPTPPPESLFVEPTGDPLTGEVVIEIRSNGLFDPPAVKIKVGTTIKWQNTERTNHKTTSDPGQAEQWDSGNLAKLVSDPALRSYSYTFTKVGRFTYRSTVAGESPDGGVIFVVE